MCCVGQYVECGTSARGVSVVGLIPLIGIILIPMIEVRLGEY
jgi:hypothetical protein